MNLRKAAVNTVVLSLLGLVLSASLLKPLQAQRAIIAGEQTPGNYINIKTDANGNLYVVGQSATNATGANWSQIGTSVGTSTLSLVAADFARTYLQVFNGHALSSVYVGTTSPVSPATGVEIRPKSAFAPLVPPTNALFIVADSASTSPVNVIEGR